MEEDYLYCNDQRVLSQVNDILGEESIDKVKVCIKNISDVDYYKVLSVLGVKAYQQKKYDIAAEAFSKFKSSNIVHGKNNFAYMIRRQEVDVIKNPEREIVQLLRQGVEIKDSFSVVNMALFWALYVGGENNWRFADKLMNYFDTSKLVQVDEWWEDLGRAGEVEGYVVHYWLLKNGYMRRSNLGSLNDIINEIKKKKLDVPNDLLEVGNLLPSDEIPDFW